MKIFNIIVILIGLSSAIVQWNDPDPLVWILAYLGIVALAVLNWLHQDHKIFTTILLTAYLITFLIYLPDLIQWISDGMPSVVESMKAENLYIELVREAGGIFLCLAISFVYFYCQIIAKKDITA